MTMHSKKIYFAAGCFWGGEHFLRKLPGVTATRVGFANGNTPAPSYREVYTDTTGYAETVEVTYDPSKMPLRRLVEAFFVIIDPLSVNRQGEDAGVQYRTGIYYTDPAMVPVIQEALSKLEAKIGQKTAIECKPLAQFFPAEEYHQDYLEKNPNGYCHIPRDLIKKVRSKK